MKAPLAVVLGVSIIERGAMMELVRLEAFRLRGQFLRIAGPEGVLLDAVRQLLASVAVRRVGPVANRELADALPLLVALAWVVEEAAVVEVAERHRLSGRGRAVGLRQGQKDRTSKHGGGQAEHL